MPVTARETVTFTGSLRDLASFFAEALPTATFRSSASTVAPGAGGAATGPSVTGVAAAGTASSAYALKLLPSAAPGAESVWTTSPERGRRERG